MNRFAVILLLVFANHSAAQDTTEIVRTLSIRGYCKNLESLSFDSDFKQTIAVNLLHQRLNFKYTPTHKITAAAEFRNRLFWGEEVKLTPDFAKGLRNENEAINLQQSWINNNSIVLHTNIERLSIEYRDSSWNAKLGRQRINWGMTTHWNPNDIFNAYNFLDFDYEERPGVDGARYQQLLSQAANIEFAYAYSASPSNHVAAAKYNINKSGYDLQFIAGVYKAQISIGAGWAGNIKNTGFKGEAQYFWSNGDSTRQFNLAVEADYVWRNGWYANVGLLYNNNGVSKPVTDWSTINLKLSPKNLMPTKWSFIGVVSKEITPLFSVNTSVLYSPGSNLFIVFPSAKYNIAANLDVDIIWQSYFVTLLTNFEAIEFLKR